MNILEARRRLLDGEIKKRTAEGENISVRSVSRMRPALALYGKSEQRTTTGAQLVDVNLLKNSSASVKILSQNEIQLTALSDGNYRQLTSYNLRIDDFKDGQCYVGGDIAYNSNDDNIPVIVIRLEDVDGETLYTYNVSLGGTAMLEVNDSIARIYFVFCMNRVNIANEGDTMTIRNFIISNREALWEPYTGGAPSPSPDYPQEIKSVGDSGAINVTLSDGGSQSQTLPVQTPNGLPGIPVSSGGNYTDADGQQWACDEVDFEREVYVQRVSQVEFDGSPDENWTIANYNGGGEKQGLINFRITKPDKRIPSYWIRYNGLLCNMFKGSNGNNVAWEYSFGEGITTDLNDIFCVANRSFVASIDEWKNHLTTYPLKLMYPVATPVETPLSPSDLAAYAALRTYSPTTVVSNDAGAWMKLGYKTKKSLEVTD